MTPWSASGQGHDPEEEEGEDCGAVGDGGESEVWRQRFVEYLDRQAGQSGRIDKWLRANPEAVDKKARAMLDAELRAWAKDVLERVHDYGMDDWGYEVRPPEETPAMVFSAGEERLRNVVKTWEARTANLAASIRGWLKQDLSVEELRKNFEGLADEAEREVKETAEGTEDDPLPPETIQACAEDARYVV